MKIRRIFVFEDAVFSDARESLVPPSSGISLTLAHADGQVRTIEIRIVKEDLVSCGESWEEEFALLKRSTNALENSKDRKMVGKFVEGPHAKELHNALLQLLEKPRLHKRLARLEAEASAKGGTLTAAKTEAERTVATSSSSTGSPSPSVAVKRDIHRNEGFRLFVLCLEKASLQQSMINLSSCRCHWYIEGAHEGSRTFVFDAKERSASLDFLAFVVVPLESITTARATLTVTCENSSIHLGAHFANLADLGDAEAFRATKLSLKNQGGTFADVAMHGAMQMRWTDEPPSTPLLDGEGGAYFVDPNVDAQAQYILRYIGRTAVPSDSHARPCPSGPTETPAAPDAREPSNAPERAKSTKVVAEGLAPLISPKRPSRAAEAATALQDDQPLLPCEENARTGGQAWPWRVSPRTARVQISRLMKCRQAGGQRVIEAARSAAAADG